MNGEHANRTDRSDSSHSDYRPYLPFPFHENGYLHGPFLHPQPVPSITPRFGMNRCLTEGQFRALLPSDPLPSDLTYDELCARLSIWLGETHNNASRASELVLASRIVTILCTLVVPAERLLHPSQLLIFNAGGVAFIPGGNLHRLVSLLLRIAVAFCRELKNCRDCANRSQSSERHRAAMMSLFHSLGPCPAYDLRKWTLAQPSPHASEPNRPTVPPKLSLIWSGPYLSGGVRQCVNLAKTLPKRIKPTRGSHFLRFRQEASDSTTAQAHNLRVYSETCGHVLRLVSSVLRVLGHASWEVRSLAGHSRSPHTEDVATSAQAEAEHRERLDTIVRALEGLTELDPALVDEVVMQSFRESDLPIVALYESEFRFAEHVFEHGWRAVGYAWGVFPGMPDDPARCGPYVPRDWHGSLSPSHSAASQIGPNLPFDHWLHVLHSLRGYSLEFPPSMNPALDPQPDLQSRHVYEPPSSPANRSGEPISESVRTGQTTIDKSPNTHSSRERPSPNSPQEPQTLRNPTKDSTPSHDDRPPRPRASSEPIDATDELRGTHTTSVAIDISSFPSSADSLLRRAHRHRGNRDGTPIQPVRQSLRWPDSDNAPGGISPLMEESITRTGYARPVPSRPGSVYGQLLQPSRGAAENDKAESIASDESDRSWSPATHDDDEPPVDET